MTWGWFWVHGVGVGMVYAIFAYTATRVANWQDDRARERRLDQRVDEMLDEISDEIQKVTEATEGVRRARHERGPND